MVLLLILFLVLAAALWGGTAGYVLLLKILRWGQDFAAPATSSPERVSVIITTLDEIQWIERKLNDIRRADYPRHLMEVIVVDGGSKDGTAQCIQERIEAGERIRFVHMEDCRSKAVQINRGVAEAEGDIIVVTDADSEWDPSCLVRLVGHLESHPETGVVSAVVQPQTSMPAEGLHWAIVNWIWWLEGEAWSASGLSGVCYAMRSAAFRELAGSAAADDIHVALGAMAGGYRVRVCPQAIVRELRVPHNIREYLGYRSRRGGRYLRALTPSAGLSRARPAGRWVVRLRRWQMRWVPPLALLAGMVGAVLLASPHWPWVIGAAAWMIASACLLVRQACLAMPVALPGGGFRLIRTACQWAGLTLLSLCCIKLDHS